MKKILITILLITSTLLANAQRTRLIQLDADTTTRPAAGLHGLAVRNSQLFAIPATGTTSRILSATTHTGTLGQFLSTNGTSNTWATITKSTVGLSNVDNTTDVSKPISTATQTALNLKSNIANPTFTGLVTTPNIMVTGLNPSQLVGTDAADNLVSLSTATYPSLAELAFTKGLTSNAQSQINGKFNTPTGLTTGNIPRWNGVGFSNSVISDDGINAIINSANNFDVRLQRSGVNFIQLQQNAGGGFIGLFDPSSQRNIALRAYGNTELNVFAGNVGIGTATPLFKLDVNGSAEFGAAYIGLPNGTLTNTLNFGYNIDNDTQDGWINYSGFNGGNTRFRNFHIGNGKNTAMMSFVGATGNVGIGITNATDKFQIDVPNVANTNLVKFSTNGGLNNYGDISVQSAELRYRSPFAIGIAPNNTVSAFFATSGNVGIGTTSPQNKLHVALGVIQVGSLSSVAINYATRQNSLVFTRSDLPASWQNIISNSWSGTNADHTMNFELANSATTKVNVMTLNALGNVGIGTTSPQQRLHSNISTAGVGVGLMLSNDATNATAGRGVEILFAGTGNANLAEIEAQTLTASNNTGGLIFRTANGGTLTERMRIDQNGAVGISSTALTGMSFRNSKNITGATISYANYSDGVLQSDITQRAEYYGTLAQTQSATFTLPSISHFRAAQGVFGAGSVVTEQIGYNVTASLIGATNNYGFRGQIASGTGRWNLFMDGTANNYMAGSLGIGSTALAGYNLRNARPLTGATNTYGYSIEAAIQEDVTSTAYGYLSVLSLANRTAPSTLVSLIHNRALQGTIGTNATVTNQFGYWADATLTGATNNYGFFGSIPSGTNRWNLYMNGTAQNYMAGPLAIGTNITNVASAILDINTTTQGVLLPRMTTTQINAIASPANGLMVYNTTLNKLCVYEASAWRQVSTTAM